MPGDHLGSLTVPWPLPIVFIQGFFSRRYRFITGVSGNSGHQYIAARTSNPAAATATTGSLFKSQEACSPKW